MKVEVLWMAELIVHGNSQHDLEDNKVMRANVLSGKGHKQKALKRKTCKIMLLYIV